MVLKKLESFALRVHWSFEQVPGLPHDSQSQVFWKTFYFHAQGNKKEKSCFADEMVPIIKSRSHFLSSFITFFERQRRVSKM